MDMKKKAVLLFGLWIAVAGPAVLAAQELPETLTLTLEDAIELALLQNPHYLATREREGQARGIVREAVSRFLPSLNLQGTNTLDEKLFVLEFPSFVPGEPAQRISIDFTKNYQMALAFSVPLFAGGRLVAGYKQAEYNLRSTQEGIRLSEQETIFDVKRAFYGYLLAREFFAVAEESLKLAEEFHKNVKNLYDVGMSTKFDLLRSEVQVANLKPQLIRAKNGRDVGELSLKTVLGIDLGKPIAVVAEGLLASTPLDPDVEKGVEEALLRRPELQQIDHQRRMAGEALKIARGAILPTLAIGGAYNSWADSLSFRKGAWQNYYSINLSLSVPLFNGFESRARIGQTKAALREIDWIRKGLADAVAFEVRQAILNYQQSRESLLSQEKNVEQAQEAVRIAELNFAEGLATALDVLTTQVALSQARTNYSQGLYDCVMSEAQLEKALGRSRPESRSN
ncbi:MAG: TolC family protein [Candidatus Aminicenantes bacterium]|nr:MAG: TolC family protein [Candidatus Aminicenantes bacterium]